MRKQLISWWFDWQQSLWFVPTVLTGAATVLAVVLVRLDHALDVSSGGHATWAFGGGASGARGVLEAIAGSIITVTGTVFSITIVALQLASSQFSPRVLRTFTSDRGVQVVLGLFVGTFTYCLLVLRSVRSELDDGAAFVPAIAVTVAVGLALVSIGGLIFYIHHIARSIQVATVADRVANDTHRLIERVFVADDDDGPPDGPGAISATRLTGADEAVSVTAAASGYLQRIDHEALAEPVSDEPVTIRCQVCIGDFVLEGTQLATISPVVAVTDDRIAAVRAAHLLGIERTLAEDVDFGLRQLADMAVKALSPGINDPTTAAECLDRLAELIGQIVRHPSLGRREDADEGQVTIVLPRRSVEQLVDTAFTQVRVYGAGDVIVMTHLGRLLGQLASLARPNERAIFVAHGRQIVAAVAQQNHLPSDRARINAALAWVR